VYSQCLPTTSCLLLAVVEAPRQQSSDGAADNPKSDPQDPKTDARSESKFCLFRIASESDEQLVTIQP